MAVRQERDWLLSSVLQDGLTPSDYQSDDFWTGHNGRSTKNVTRAPNLYSQKDAPNFVFVSASPVSTTRHNQSAELFLFLPSFLDRRSNVLDWVDNVGMLDQVYSTTAGV